MKRTVSVVTIVLLLAAGVALAADGFDLSWHALSGGGGHSTGGQFTLDGGVVQPAGVSQGGNYEVQSGFFYGLAAPKPSLSADVDGDCDVDIVDIMLVASRWNSFAGDGRYDPRYDRDHDGDIDIVDIMLVASHWGEVCPAAAPAAKELPERARVEAAEREMGDGPVLRIEPELSAVQPGDAFTVGVVADGIADLGGLEFALTFDSEVLSVEGVELGPLLASTGREAQALGPAVGNGVLRLGGFSLGEGPGAVGGGVVVRIHLRAVAAGSSRLVLSAARLADTQGQAVSAGVEGEGAVVVSGAGEVPALPPRGEPKVVPLPTREGP